MLVSNGNYSAVAWHPSRQRYFSPRSGNTIFPLITWTGAGGLPYHVDSCGRDTRGMWFNPNTGLLERNCFNTIGWGPVDMDADGRARWTTTVFQPGMNQPNSQSVAAYDPVGNELLFYYGATPGVVYRYSRATGALLGTLALTGSPTWTVNSTTMIWTGQAGYEIGLSDYTNRRILLFNASTGAFTASVQLPATAAASSQYRFSYANNRVWLFNASTPGRVWRSYCIWQQGCPEEVWLPVELVHLIGNCDEGAARLKWSTGSELNSSHFEIERSTDAREWTFAGRVESAGNSQQLIEYAWSDPEPLDAPVVYYRLRQVDLDGTDEMFDVLTVTGCGPGSAEIAAYPNPATDLLHVSFNVTEAIEGGRLELRDAMGRPVSRKTLSVEAGQSSVQFDLSGLAPGAYLLQLTDARGSVVDKIHVVKL